MTLEQRVSANETTINQLMSLQGTTLEFIREIKELQVSQSEWLKRMEARHTERMDRMDQRMDRMDQRMDQMNQRMDQMNRHMDQQLEEMRRFNRGTRKLWIAIAKKEDWLDEDDWPED